MAPEPRPSDVEKMIDIGSQLGAKPGDTTDPVASPSGQHAMAAATGEPGEAAIDRPSTPAGLVDAVRRLEGSTALDRPAELLENIADAVAPVGPRRDILQGSWLGHALHPLLTDFPLGMWMSASLLDLIGGRRSRPAATRLVAAGIAAAVPTAAAGMAEWLDTDPAARRVGVVHANVNSVAMALYTGSLIARLRGRHGRAVAWGIAGGLTATAGGYLGGHLSLARKVGTRDPRFTEPAKT